MLARLPLFVALAATTGCASTVVPQWPDGDVASDASDASDRSRPFPTPQRPTWTAGWDRFDEPFDLNASSVSYSVAPGALNVQYELRRAIPGRRYAFGVHLFRDAMQPCAPTFGPFANTGCSSASRQGSTHAYAAYDATHVVIAADGSASASVSFAPIPAGHYVLEFHTRVDCSAFPGCDVVLQSPGPWGVGTVTVDIP